MFFDEWYKKVNNLVFINVVVKLSFLFLKFVGNVMNIKFDLKYKVIVDKMYIFYDK